MSPADLPLGLTAEALTAAAAEADPESLAASVRLRHRFDPELAAAAVTQVVLRRRAVAKFGAAAHDLFFTRDGLEQATRPEVAAHHADRFRRSGADLVVDLGCGIGTDAMSCLRAGAEVVAVERDPRTAEVARANLGTVGQAYDVQTADAEERWPRLRSDPRAGVFADPARRSERGRSWRVQDLSPGWPFVLELLDSDRPAGVKLGPGLAHRHLPAGVEAEWISHRGDTVELALWAGAGSTPGQRSALVLDPPSGPASRRLVTDPAAAPPPVRPPGRYLYEPLGAVIRSGGLATLGRDLDAGVLHEEVAYLVADTEFSTPYATAFTVLDTFAYREKQLRDWARAAAVGTLEIKTRGLDLDPADLRRRLRLRGPNAATVFLTRTVAGPTALVAVRQ